MTKVVLDPNHFDSKARQWDANPVFRDRAERIAAGIRAEVALTRDMAALDYGCGSGLLSFPFKDEVGRITCKDTSAGMLDVLREKIAEQGVTNMTVRQTDLTADPLPDERYDLIYSSMTLHHIPDTAHILAVFHQLLNPGGHLCIADLDREDGSFHGIEVDVHHGFDRDALAGLARAAGFRDVRFRTVFEIVKERDDGQRAYPVFLMTAGRD
ncbi:class I SAM-dependent methyltransferase [Parasulfuritortus cantonensis]|uniref:Class I SAM-dependent methyltransferase n=1 Tax=Parasulfuritortus cantonensis TaxID=2528202 RepID=A0A4V2NW51_9PROT|nr:class I SAM-dependent methyltransferase [Parasulfuritortus cantonensis]TCJ15982.1 class I SAM-dependent methyltransferase [Parasulfuritortus cantonensis]